jgi:ABC-type transport system involved in multi-copper enzyme maturation permease subunit
MNEPVSATRGNTAWERTWNAVVDASPVLGKELLVTARTPIYLGSILLAPACLGALVFVAWISMRSSTYATEGKELFSVYFVSLALILGVVGAALGSTVIVQEREAGTLEALKFSTLGPHRIVVGKFTAVVLAEAAIAVSSLPLLAFIKSLGGVSLAEMAVAWVIAMTCGALTASVGVAVSAQATHMRRAFLVSLVASSAVGIGVAIWLGVSSDLAPTGSVVSVARTYFDLPWSRRAVPILFIAPGVGMTTTLWLGHAVATSGLMDRSLDRSWPLKRWALAALLLVTAGLAASARITSEHLNEGYASAAMVATGCLGAVLLFVFAGEPVSPTRRMRATRPSGLRALLYPPALGPSIVFVIVATGLALVSAPLLAGATSRLELQALWGCLFLATVGGLVGTVAATLGRTHARVVWGVAILFPMVFVGMFRGSCPSWVDGVCPLWLGALGHFDEARVATSGLLPWGVASVASLALMLYATRAAKQRAATGAAGGRPT